MSATTKKRIGIPYARWIAPDYTERECPVCGERFTEGADETGETMTNNYGKHYAEQHQEEA